MIQKLAIRNVATYDEEGIEINDLKKINFIYGANGTGKTTISEFIHAPSAEQYTDCEIEWENNTPVKALVYNKGFRERNFGKGKIDGVFTIGQATKEEVEAIDKLQKELGVIKETGTSKKEAIEELEAKKEEVEEKLKNVLWDEVYKKYNIYFKEAFTGYGRKEAFKTKLMEEFEGNKQPVDTLAELKEKAATLFGEDPVVLPRMAAIQFDRLLEIEADAIWTKKIIGKEDVGIAALIQQLTINDWVNEGRTHIHGDSKTCPFCQQETITPDFKKQLADYFDEAFTQDTKKVKQLSEEYLGISQNLLQTLQNIETTEKANGETKLDSALFTAYNKIVSGQLAVNREQLANKMKEPSRSIQVASSKEAIANVQKLIDDANEKINAHNDIVNDYANQKALLIKAIWKYLADSGKAKVEDANKKLEKLDKEMKTLEAQRQELLVQYQAIDKQIKGANKSVTGVQSSVDEMNRLLKLHGFLNFLIVPSPQNPHQYQIQRQDGTLAESTLSEGEVTFITFLYFLQLAKGSTQQDTITEERILVVDDPISNLDSNALFLVSSLINECIKNINDNRGHIRQLIVLTHNIHFHKAVSSVYNKMKATAGYSFYMLHRNDNVTSIQEFGSHNPIVDGYELLWQAVNNAEGTSLLTRQSSMRQIIDQYCKMVGKSVDENLLLQGLEDAQEREIARALITRINDNYYIEPQEESAGKYVEVFRKIFAEMGHQEHFEMMFQEQEVAA